MIHDCYRLQILRTDHGRYAADRELLMTDMELIRADGDCYDRSWADTMPIRPLRPICTLSDPLRIGKGRYHYILVNTGMYRPIRTTLEKRTPRQDRA